MADLSVGEGRVIVSALLVFKPSPAGSGNQPGSGDWYIQRSIRDYFIKFCESAVSRAELESYVAQKESDFITATLDVEFREGHWDDCDGTALVQGKAGPYAVVHRLLKE